MSELKRFDLDGVDFVLVEVDADGPDISPVSRTADVVEAATTSFGTALSHVRAAASVALTRFREMDTQPDEIQLEFGVKLTTEAGAVIAKTAAEGNLKVYLTWRRPGTEPADAGNVDGD
ncbi:CU044_2847 family protein [Plantactinospora soyae]|uniref:Trypsin-co-occurring domain-containing protein n=1 Tax=Plantactinospora soyae TaxID=1544732 RepID=A0A927MIG3_9ACTN|nr:CU044_2847 family protein [Plantactinospora soyae]MBE1491755.1 hypothetical protein [Plantactinospora soyae]